MFSGNDFSSGSVCTPSSVEFHRIPVDAGWPTAPEHPESIALTLQRVWRESRMRLQRTIDAVESQVAVLNAEGEIAAVNRTWRMTAKINGLAHPKFGVGLNYLAVCRHAAAAGDRDAAFTAEGIDGVLQARSRSFYYKYRVQWAGELRYYAVMAWRFVEDGSPFVAVSHELLESHALAAGSR